MPTVTVLPGEEIVPAAPGESILEALFKSGYSYRVGCRRGGCAICKVDLLAGEVGYNRTVCDTVLSEEEKAAGTVLSCRAVPTADITIRLRDERIRLTNRMVRQVRLAQYEKAVGSFAPANDSDESPTPVDSRTKES